MGKCPHRSEPCPALPHSLPQCTGKLPTPWLGYPLCPGWTCSRQQAGNWICTQFPNGIRHEDGTSPDLLITGGKGRHYLPKKEVSTESEGELAYAWRGLLCSLCPGKDSLCQDNSQPPIGDGPWVAVFTRH